MAKIISHQRIVTYQIAGEKHQRIEISKKIISIIWRSFIIISGINGIKRQNGEISEKHHQIIINNNNGKMKWRRKSASSINQKMA